MISLETFSSAELLSYEKKPSQKKRTVEVSVADNDVKQADSSSDDEASTSEEEFEKTTSEAKRAKRETKRELDALEMNLAARGNAAPTVIEAEIDDDDEEEVTIKVNKTGAGRGGYVRAKLFLDRRCARSSC